jgi:hypothetical protein
VSRRLQRYHVRIAFVGSPEESFREIVGDFQEQLDLRLHLGNPRVHWHPERQQMMVEIDSAVDATRFSVEQGANAVAEEVTEAVFAVLGDFERFRVEIVEINELPD